MLLTNGQLSVQAGYLGMIPFIVLVVVLYAGFLMAARLDS